MSEVKIKLIEVADSWQGEGPDSGRQMLIARFKRCNLRCSYCLSPDTKIHLVNGKPKKIKDLEINEKLICYNEETKQLDITSVTSKTKLIRNDLWRIVCDRNKVICTPEHRWLTKDGWKETKDIIDGDVILQSADLELSKFKMHINNPLLRDDVKIKLNKVIKEYWNKSENRDRQSKFHKSIDHRSMILGDKNPMKNPENVRRQIEKRSNWKPSRLELRVEKICNEFNLPFMLCNMKTRVGKRYPDFIMNGGVKKAIEAFDPTFIDLESPKNLEKSSWGGYQTRGDSDYINRKIKEYNDNGWEVLPLAITNHISTEEIVEKITSFSLNGSVVQKCEPVTFQCKGPLSKHKNTVYDISCNPHKTFFANGLLSHNCDTIIKMQSTYEGEYTIDQLNKALEKTKGLMISGGEPSANFPDNDNFKQTIHMLKYCNYEVANIETNGFGIVELLKEIDSICSDKNIKILYSPKIFNKKSLEIEHDKIVEVIEHPKVYLKIVPFNEETIELCKRLKKIDVLKSKIYLMPLGTTKIEIEQNWKNTIDLADECGFNLSSRLHIVHEFT